MKETLALLLFVGWSCAANAQSTLEFTTYLHGLNVVPPSTGHGFESADGTGTFTLTGNTLTYDITTDLILGWRGKFYGPAVPGVNGPELYDLSIPRHEAPDPNPGGHDGLSWFRGSILITDEQIPELTAGLWYVQISEPLRPSMAIRGQIVLVPEPSALWLTVIFAFGLAARSVL